jgi:hypothetical protein
MEKNQMIVGAVGIATLGSVCISCQAFGIDGIVTTAIVGAITALLGALLGISLKKVSK